MKTWLLISVVLAAGTGCTAMRASGTQTEVPSVGHAMCHTRDDLRRDLRGVDDRIDIPGGGQIEVYDVLLRPPNERAARQWLLSIASLGVVDIAASAIDVAYECSEDSAYSGVGAKCDYKAVRYYAHYATRDSDQPACVERREMWAGAGQRPWGDESTCPVQYRTSLSRLIDTSELPSATIDMAEAARAEGVNLDKMSVQEQLRLFEQIVGAVCAETPGEAS